MPLEEIEKPLGQVSDGQQGALALLAKLAGDTKLNTKMDGVGFRSSASSISN
jgi:hypothetical protein